MGDNGKNHLLDDPSAGAAAVLSAVRALVEAQGLAFLGVARLMPEVTESGRLRHWLDDGRNAGMQYLAENQALRADPRSLLEGARTAIIVGLAYYQGDRDDHGERLGPRVAQYARLKDYHKVLWSRGEGILADLHRAYDPKAVGRVVTDSAPILERALAARAGSGFIGKNTCFIQPERGSFYLLGELLTSFDIPDTEMTPVDPQTRSAKGGCGSCKRCQVHCPTGALDQDYSLDARRCLAYWTIEHRGTIPERFWPWLEQYVFGCDICQLVCPYNRKVEPAPVEGLARVEARPALFEVATLTQSEYERRFGGTPMTRAKRTGLMRNALIAMTVTGDVRLDEAKVLAAERGDEVVHATLAQIACWQASDGRLPAQD